MPWPETCARHTTGLPKAVGRFTTGSFDEPEQQLPDIKCVDCEPLTPAEEAQERFGKYCNRLWIVFTLL